MPIAIHHGEPVGIVAGWGEYPIAVAEGMKRLGFQVIGAGVRDHVDARFPDLCHAYVETGIGGLGKQIRFFKKWRVRSATMAGKIFKAKVLFRGWGWIQHFPDWTTLTTFLPHFVYRTRDKRDDSLLLAVVNAFEKSGIKLSPATDFAPEVLMPNGMWSDSVPSQSEKRDIAFGWRLAKEMGRLDIGQSVCVKGQAVLAVEAIEGTDECIRRAGKLCPQGGFTVVKVAKPQQDMRFDVPTIGIGTLESMREAGAKVLAVEADQTIALDQANLKRAAQELGIRVFSLKSSEVAGGA